MQMNNKKSHILQNNITYLVLSDNISGINVSRILSPACFYCLGMLIGTDRGRSLIQSHSSLINHYYALAFTLGRITQIAGMLPYTTHNKPVWADSWLLKILVSTFLSASLQKTNVLDNTPPSPTIPGQVVSDTIWTFPVWCTILFIHFPILI